MYELNNFWLEIVLLNTNILEQFLHLYLCELLLVKPFFTTKKLPQFGHFFVHIFQAP
ncbi:hypothetical protein Q9Q60_01140 [Campylobacter upsaliensis]|uniref:hypothetical protein n=1 Tax=Campylobacter upsaliensis TaxID=28080 RepID=UPI0022EB32F1|nr:MULTISPECIES: hypothetical protein [Campylobacter]ELS3707723.1 hypothetical protein [Campylobacter upsaliensis]MDL0110103.1 hypothetical protein [Campylobacter felis]MEB2790851.1 hypothetical protein [Campylobacter upsaliensis]MEB2806549.1 hypothetical protein [Campylobacter upsaliensis]MEB2818217.1 hypothetical protein [Campylobacter upsaliensis]